MSAKVIYEVRVEVDQEVAPVYLVWLREHIRQIVRVAGFERAELFAQQESSGPVQVWLVHYVAASLKTIEDYLSEHSQKFRAEGVERFDGRFQIERKILLLQETVTDLTEVSTS